MDSCAPLREEIVRHVARLVRTEEGPHGACIAVLPLLDFNHEPVEVYVEETPQGILVSDWKSVRLKFDEAGYDSDETPDDELFERTLETYGAKEDPVRGLTIPPDGREDLADRVWRLGSAISEANQILIKGRYSFRFNFRRTIRDFLVEKGIHHQVRPKYRAVRIITPDFAVGPSELLAFNALHADSRSQAASLIAKTFEDIVVLQRARDARKLRPPSLRLTVVYNDESEIPSSDRFQDLSQVCDEPPIPAAEAEDQIPEAIARAEEQQVGA